MIILFFKLPKFGKLCKNSPGGGAKRRKKRLANSIRIVQRGVSKEEGTTRDVVEVLVFDIY